MGKELLEIAIITGILINLRPRNWPQFYTLDVPYDPMLVNYQINEEQPMLGDFRVSPAAMETISVHASSYLKSS